MANTFVDFGESNGHKCFPKLGLMSKDLARFDEKKFSFFISSQIKRLAKIHPIR